MRAIAGAALVTAVWGGAVWGQDSSLSLTAPAQETQLSPTAPCVQPERMVSWEDYHGPLQKVVGAFGRRLEHKSANAPHYKPGALLCVLSLHDKFLLSVRETFDPVTLLGIAYDAGIGQHKKSFPSCPRTFCRSSPGKWQPDVQFY